MYRVCNKMNAMNAGYGARLRLKHEPEPLKSNLMSLYSVQFQCSLYHRNRSLYSLSLGLQNLMLNLCTLVLN